MPTNLFDLIAGPESRRDDDVVRHDIRALIAMHKNGSLGGAVMPEDAHPQLPADGRELAHYFTLGMSLNYQRNSYALWKAATAAYEDGETRPIFDPKLAAKMDVEQLKALLTKHRVGLQPVKHTQTWRALCVSFTELYDGDVRNLFAQCSGDIESILSIVQNSQKKRFPYLSGPKIANYWLYVISTYTNLPLSNRAALNVAPDTHVIQASRQLGLISQEDMSKTQAPLIVAERWKQVLLGTDIAPIDVHTPLWLWSRGGFKHIERDSVGRS